ncbi:hypothetical protein ASG56_17280 [Rhodococcus sp. Leaf7]|uniref:hypothetical protein n=1 Tax=unclassified Rhodococcus (in: high G+C Gram-positive bacteria) TaxID=192944 RepID=UPI0006FC2513|nr:MULTISPECIES: hypothetical protein [unclassified Rhodococcus (in: high G+C Gram-positive bacteria)]KQU02665.1 hypothetical protein ASG56_17280 [Rhodococcus sp. Leaf7]KQU38137.1 hypothetical protein ASG64_20010 [Rhodococcus sp. Leaf247]
MVHRAAPVAAVVVLAVLVLVLGVVNPVRMSSVRTDALGPDNDETAEQYLDRVGAPVPGDDPQWALVSFSRELTADEVPSVVDGTRVSVVYVHVVVDRVQTPLVEVPVPDTRQVVIRSVREAARLVPPGRSERGRAVQTLVRNRLLADCACVAGVLVRSTGNRLVALAGSADIRAVEALPTDAVFGRFAVAPLYPERVGDAVQPDDGPLPPA